MNQHLDSAKFKARGQFTLLMAIYVKPRIPLAERTWHLQQLTGTSLSRFGSVEPVFVIN